MQGYGTDEKRTEAPITIYHYMYQPKMRNEAFMGFQRRLAEISGSTIFPEFPYLIRIEQLKHVYWSSAIGSGNVFQRIKRYWAFRPAWYSDKGLCDSYEKYVLYLSNICLQDLSLQQMTAKSRSCASGTILSIEWEQLDHLHEKVCSDRKDNTSNKRAIFRSWPF